jgi:hypothetical protein
MVGGGRSHPGALGDWRNGINTGFKSCGGILRRTTTKAGTRHASSATTVVSRSDLELTDAGRRMVEIIHSSSIYIHFSGTVYSVISLVAAVKTRLGSAQGEPDGVV